MYERVPKVTATPVSRRGGAGVRVHFACDEWGVTVSGQSARTGEGRTTLNEQAPTARVARPRAPATSGERGLRGGARVMGSLRTTGGGSSPLRVGVGEAHAHAQGRRAADVVEVNGEGRALGDARRDRKGDGDDVVDRARELAANTPQAIRLGAAAAGGAGHAHGDAERGVSTDAHLLGQQAQLDDAVAASARDAAGDER